MEFDLKIFIYNPCEIINLNYYFSSFRTDRSIPCILLQNFKYYVTADFLSFISLLLLSRKVSIEMFTIHSSHRTYQIYQTRGVIGSRIVSIPSGGNRIVLTFSLTCVYKTYAVDGFPRSFQIRRKEIRRGDSATIRRGFIAVRETNWLDFNEQSIVGRKGEAGPRVEITEEWHTYVSRERFLE